MITLTLLLCALRCTDGELPGAVFGGSQTRVSVRQCGNDWTLGIHFTSLDQSGWWGFSATPDYAVLVQPADKYFALDFPDLPVGWRVLEVRERTLLTLSRKEIRWKLDLEGDVGNFYRRVRDDRLHERRFVLDERGAGQ